jgi:methylenetetrahydrofolate--tRNA-(uracil-5-)-methyltransferase
MFTQEITVIGAGLAGVEAAWQLAKRGIKVSLKEMRPKKQTPAHQTGYFAELVCSNSLRSDSMENAVGILKEEMRLLDSLVISCADQTRLPAGGALAVDRLKFAALVTEKISSHKNIQVKTMEVKDLTTTEPTIVASGPLTSEGLFKTISELTGSDNLYFYDAAAPIVTTESVDMGKAFWASRYDKGDADYLNCPMNPEQYLRFYEYLISAETHKPKDFEKEVYFEGCMPIEAMAKRGEKTLLFGPLKPVGLVDPNATELPHAVVQLRKDNLEGTLLNLVGFQTSIKWNQQKEAIRLIPGLENADIVRYGVIHKNTYLNSPTILKPTYQLINYPNIFFAGQITGVEGYVESAASGLVAGINGYNLIKGKGLLTFPTTTALGALSNYITRPGAKNFQPMNINFGLFQALDSFIKDKTAKRLNYAKRSLSDLKVFIEKNIL